MKPTPPLQEQPKCDCIPLKLPDGLVEHEVHCPAEQPGELVQYVTEMLDHQRLIDYGKGDWREHADKLATMIAELPTIIESYVDRERLEAEVETLEKQIIAWEKTAIGNSDMTACFRMLMALIADNRKHIKRLTALSKGEKP